ncbi:hypothetical protein H2200_004450 [Cladophialophora chaetospira]|uniref:Signal recognition particle subunit SRP14 n=1 Tax=Cladophialophora chaetospira TaxID=386627 RepID=A0AA39CJH8_9EURO|nr:hypothetical protein H2200_004450 [Cladophialophora chaetospira]
MAQERLNNDDFLTRLTSLLTSTHAQSHGSIYLTQKPLPPSTDASTTSQSAPQILIRATNGVGKPKKSSPSTSKASKSKSTTTSTTASTKPKIKFATVVDVAELEGFYARYAEVCKKGMEGLRKRDKKKAKERAKAKKKGKSGA